MQLPQLNPLMAAIERLSSRLQPVAAQRTALAQVAGRVLAADLVADRDSPPLDVSAMDGYALRLGEELPSSLPVQATAAAGSEPLSLLPGHAIRIFTGAALPAGADCVVRREDTIELPQQVQLTVPVSNLHRGQNIRRRGENSSRGTRLLARGTLIDASRMAAIASFGTSTLSVYRPLRVAVLNTGDELAEPGDMVEDWQIRDSNGPTLAAWLQSLAWVEPAQRQRVGDTLHDVQVALAAQLADSDAVLITGGVSMGDTDYVPAAIESLGGEIVFHRLPIRPGKPVLGAVLDGKLIVGLPGNPVSVAVTARVVAEPLLKKLAGYESAAQRLAVQLVQPDVQRLDLICFRLVRIDAAGAVHLVSSRGSGDLVSLSQSSGFVEISAGGDGQGLLPLTLW